MNFCFFFVKIKKNEFLRNILILSTGTTVAQALPILIAPILSRLYSPTELGTLALYLAIVRILSSIINLRYELAIILPKDLRDSVTLVLLSGWITVVISIITFFIILAFHDQIVDTLGNNDISLWIYFIPLNMLFIGFYNVLNNYNIRQKKFTLISKSNIIKSIGNSGGQTFFGCIQASAGGLIGSQIVSYLLGNIGLVRNFFKQKNIIREIQYYDLKKMAIRYKEFPLFSVWGIFLNTISLNIINIFINKLYSTYQLGLYSYGYKYLTIPSALVGDAIGQVFLQKSSEEKNEYGNAKCIFLLVLKKISIIGFLFFGFLYFLVEDIFAFIFGEEWRIAGSYAKIAMPLLLIRFITTPLTLITVVFERQKLMLLLQAISFIITVLTALSAYYLNFSIEVYLSLNTLLLTIYYLFMLFILYRVARGNKDRL